LETALFADDGKSPINWTDSMGLGKLGTALTAREILGHRLERPREDGSGTAPGVGRHIEAGFGDRASSARQRRQTAASILLLVSCRLYQEPSPEAIQLASIIELIHTASWSTTT